MAGYDVAIAGAGVLGLAHAYHLARRGAKVAVVERSPRAMGASVRNFGMIWPIGQPAGNRYQLAMRSRQHWLEVLEQAGIWHDHCGSLHVAYHEDEAQVLREFHTESQLTNRGNEMLTPLEIANRFPAINQDRLVAGLYSPEETCIDPREAISKLPSWLHKTYGVDFHFNTQVLRYEHPHVVTSGGTLRAEHLILCTGQDFQALAPEAFHQADLKLCKLQMMRSQPFGNTYQIKAMLAAGLTLTHYQSFAHCPTLPTVRARLEQAYPAYKKFGIHVLVSQHQAGSLCLGDSHEYGEDITPFDRSEIDDLVLSYLQQFLAVPNLHIQERWHGIYVKHASEPYLIIKPQPTMTAITGVGGAGMTLSFGLAEQVVDGILESTCIN